MEGSVSVNGRPATNLNHPVSASDAVSVNGQPLAQAEKRTVYLLLNKPRGYLCAVSDSRGRPTVLDLVPDALRVAGLVPVGRLDADSTGLLLLSNDGAFVERVTHPRYGVVKEYDVLLDRALWPRDQARLLDGVEIEGGLARALSVSPMGNAESHRPRTAQRSTSRPAPAAPRGEARYAVELAEGEEAGGAADDACGRTARAPADARACGRVAARQAAVRQRSGNLCAGSAKGVAWLTREGSSGSTWR